MSNEVAQRSMASELIDRMQGDVAAWVARREVDLAAKYRADIERAGTASFLSELFMRFSDSTLADWLAALTFAWKDVPFTVWREVLRAVATNASAMYQFVPFASRYLAIDILSAIRDDAAMSQADRSYVLRRFSSGGPPPGSPWLRDMLREHGVDQEQMWRRLAAEGAPMRLPTP